MVLKFAVKEKGVSFLITVNDSSFPNIEWQNVQYTNIVWNKYSIVTKYNLGTNKQNEKFIIPAKRKKLEIFLM